MTDRKQPTLVKLGDTDLTVADPAEDIRGHTVIDQAGEEIGKVDALVIDDEERKVRFLQVAAGGFLGIGERTFLIPVDAVTGIEEDRVQIDQTRDRVVGAPPYDPGLAEQPHDSYMGAYGYYGYAPYWSAGYAYPGLSGYVAGRPLI